jgi:hypothetical protein
MAQLKSGTRIYGDATIDGRLGLGTNSNIRIGDSNTGCSITTGVGNFFVGSCVGAANTSGSYNNFFGKCTGRSNSTGRENNFFGCFAGCTNTTGSYNNFFGTATGKSNITGSFNNFLGLYAGCSNTANHNNFFGRESGKCNTTGRYNVFFGFLSGFCNISGISNNYFGAGSGRFATSSHNNFFGFYAGKNATGGYNTIFGFNSGCNLTSGTNNFFAGCGAARGTGVVVNTGSNNIAIGSSSGFLLTSGSNNNFLGYQAGYANTTGSCNNFFGQNAGCSNTSGSNNNFFGAYAGCTQTSGNRNVAIGYSVQLPIITGDDQLIIGSGSTSWITGNSSFNVGIGTTNPTQKLHILGNARVTGAVYDSTNSAGTTGQVLQSTQTGTLWATAAAGGSGKFDTTIDNVIYVQPTGTLDIVGVGTTVTQITTLPSGSNKYLVHSIHVTNISNGDAEITAGFVMNARKVPATISIGGGAGINTITVGSASSIIVGMAVTGQGNIGETTGIGSTAGFQYNTYVTSVDGNNITLSKPIAGRSVSGTVYFSPVSKVSSRLPVPVGSAVELLKQPMVLNALDSIVLQSTGAGTGIGSTSTAAISQTANSNILTVTAGAAITNFLSSGMLIQPTGNNTGIQTNTFVGVGYTPGSLSIPMTRPATVALASTSLSFTEVVVPQDGALQATIVYQSSTDTAYLNGTGTVSAASSTITSVTAGLSTIPVAYYGTGITYPSIIQSIRVANISDGLVYPGGDYPVSVGIGNSDTIFSWLAYNMIIPKNSSIELCEAPKRIGIGQSIFAITNTPYAIEIQVAGKQKTS